MLTVKEFSDLAVLNLDPQNVGGAGVFHAGMLKWLTSRATMAVA
jgi:hypothetical protein